MGASLNYFLNRDKENKMDKKETKMIIYYPLYLLHPC